MCLLFNQGLNSFIIAAKALVILRIKSGKTWLTWGAVMRRAAVASMVKRVKVMRHSLSNTMAANFQSLSSEEESSSARIFSVITRNSFSIIFSSRTAPEGRGLNLSSWHGSSWGDLKKTFQFLSQSITCQCWTFILSYKMPLFKINECVILSRLKQFNIT